MHRRTSLSHTCWEAIFWSSFMVCTCIRRSLLSSIILTCRFVSSVSDDVTWFRSRFRITISSDFCSAWISNLPICTTVSPEWVVLVQIRFKHYFKDLIWEKTKLVDCNWLCQKAISLEQPASQRMALWREYFLTWIFFYAWAEVPVGFTLQNVREW